MWARSKGAGPHFFAGLTIGTEWTQLQVSDELQAALHCIECIELSDQAPADGEPAAPVSDADDTDPGLFRRKKKGK